MTAYIAVGFQNDTELHAAMEETILNNLNLFRVDALAELLYHSSKARLAHKVMVKAVLRALEDNAEMFANYSASVNAQVLVGLNLSGSMLSKAGIPTPLLKACAHVLKSRVHHLSREELHVLRQTLEVVGDNSDHKESEVFELKDRIKKALD